jgi:hypothetical protein
MVLHRVAKSSEISAAYFKPAECTIHSGWYYVSGRHLNADMVSGMNVSMATGISESLSDDSSFNSSMSSGSAAAFREVGGGGGGGGAARTYMNYSA